MDEYLCIGIDETLQNADVAWRGLDIYKEKSFVLDLVTFIFHISTGKQTSYRESTFNI